MTWKDDDVWFEYINVDQLNVIRTLFVKALVCGLTKYLYSADELFKAMHCNSHCLNHFITSFNGWQTCSSYIVRMLFENIHT